MPQESRETLLQLLNHPDLAAIPLLIFANKQDVEGAVTMAANIVHPNGGATP